MRISSLCLGSRSLQAASLQIWILLSKVFFLFIFFPFIKCVYIYITVIYGVPWGTVGVVRKLIWKSWDSFHLSVKMLPCRLLTFCLNMALKIKTLSDMGMFCRLLWRHVGHCACLNFQRNWKIYIPVIDVPFLSIFNCCSGSRLVLLSLNEHWISQIMWGFTLA